MEQLTFNELQTLYQWGEKHGAKLINESGHKILAQFDGLYEELGEDLVPVSPTNRKRLLRRNEALVYVL